MPTPSDVEGWLAELGLAPIERAEREDVTSWDLLLDGRRRYDVRITLILDPLVGLIAWAHYAPPIGDGLRRAYRQLLRWNDEIPFAKFSLTEDGRPVLAAELAAGALGRDELGLALARLLAICDRLLEDSAGWIWIGGRMPSTAGRESRGAGIMERYAEALGELVA